MLLNLLALAIVSAFYPTLLAVTLILLSTPRPRGMLVGYLSGALIASTGVGLAIVFVLEGTGAVGDARPSVSPAADLVGGVLALALAWLIASGRVAQVRDRRRRAHPKRRQGPSWSERTLSRDSTAIAFGVAVVLSFAPGLFYLVALKDIAEADYAPAVAVVLVLAFNVVMFTLIEIPLVGYVVAPERTGDTVRRANAWLGAHSRPIMTWVCIVAGVYLIVRGIVGLVT